MTAICVHSIKSCPPNTFGRYVTIQQDDDTYLTLCEVVVYGDCDATGQHHAVTDGEAHGSGCHFTLYGTAGESSSRSWSEAEADCVRRGGHLASIHNRNEFDDAVAVIQVGTQADAQHGTWIGLNDVSSECGCDGSCFVWSDGTANDWQSGWADGEPNDWSQGQGNCDGGKMGLGSAGQGADGRRGEDCAKFDVSGEGWKDETCFSSKPYLCRMCDSATSNPDLPSPPSVEQNPNSCSCNMVLHFHQLDWQSAETSCVSEGGHLASVHSQADADAVQQLVTNGGGTTAWIGLTDSAVEGKEL